MLKLQSVGMNVAGVGWIVALARKMNHLEVIVGIVRIIVFLSRQWLMCQLHIATVTLHT